jgi:hypothetical protein
MNKHGITVHLITLTPTPAREEDPLCIIEQAGAFGVNGVAGAGLPANTALLACG